MIDRINNASAFISEKIGFEPEIGMILGSGLGDLAEDIENKVYISYNDIPNFPVSTVEGHKGRFVAGDMGGKKVIAMQGRFHYYEGYSQKEVTFPVRVMKNLGVSKLIVTNAAGGVNTDFRAGDLMIIEDHINFTFRNPLIGKNEEELGPRFPDTSEAYSRRLVGVALEASNRLGISLKKGVYQFNQGPSYETPAEIRMSRTLGADAVGMSTVPVVIVAAHAGMETLGISCITNMAAGILDQPLNHQEVIETAEIVRADFIRLVKEIVQNV